MANNAGWRYGLAALWRISQRSLKAAWRSKAVWRSASAAKPLGVWLSEAGVNGEILEIMAENVSVSILRIFVSANVFVKRRKLISAAY